MKRLVIVTNSAVINTDSRNAITAFLEAKGWSIWHWFQDLWLADNVPDETDLTELRIEILNVVPGAKHIMVMGADSKDHSGMVPSASIPWLKEHWQKNR